ASVRNAFRKWLQTAAPKAQVVKGYDISLNAVAVKLNGTPLSTLGTSPLVVRAEYEGLYYPTADDPDLGAISAAEGWANAGQTSATAGSGVKVGVIDTGIDITNPCFSDAGYAPIAQLGQTKYTNNKVFVAKVFSNKLNQSGFDAAPAQDHGTHVAGTIACDFGTPATVNGVAIPYGLSGVAPHALLGSYNIFPGTLLNARSEDILNALDAAYTDGMDVVNMSLGGGQKGVQDLLTVAVDNLDQANMISAVAAGNSGPGFSTVESPGSAARALTAGASSVGHFVGTPMTAGSDTFALASGDFKAVSADVMATLAVVMSGGSMGLACTSLPVGSLTGKIAVVSRGTCSFSTKIRFAQEAGAAVAVVVNNVAGDPVAMGTDGTPNQPTIPAYMAAMAGRDGLIADNGVSATIPVAESYFQTTNTDIMAGFSSQGPTNVDYRVKPDVTAPGVNVLSSIPAAFCAAPPCFAFFQGTSMATPHIAGSAAVLRQQHPDWPAWAVRSAVVNTADVGVLTDAQTGTHVVTDVNTTGAGRENLASATTAQVVLDSVSVSF
ncbi:MAG TPA: S8 family serine peptidase, partial [Candidatus Limnocylindrales bacterium]